MNRYAFTYNIKLGKKVIARFRTKAEGPNKAAAKRNFKNKIKDLLKVELTSVELISKDEPKNPSTFDDIFNRFGDIFKN